MELLIETGALAQAADEAIVVTVFEDAKEFPLSTAAVDTALGGSVRDLLDSGDFKGKRNETALLRTAGKIPAKRVLVVGLGKQADLTMDRTREAIGKAARQLKDMGLKTFTTAIPGDGGSLSAAQQGQAIAEGLILGTYAMDEYRTQKREDIKNLDRATVRTAETNADFEAGFQTGRKIAGGTVLARNLTSRPGNVCTPTMLARTAEELAAESHGVLKTTVFSYEECKTMGMGAFCAVAQGSEEPAKFIVMEYKPANAKGKPVAIIGKGITFDTGGISIKPGAGMEAMKYDMAGSAAVIGAMKALIHLQLPLHVIGIVPSTDNMPSGGAYKPGDVLVSLSGQTIEVVNTDAEGRAVLCDALTYAARTFKPEWMIDLATLTGACVVALGHHAIGMIGTDNALMDTVRSAGDLTGEKVWELPFWDEYQDLLKSDIADMKNSAGRDAGTIAGAVFLGKYVEKTPWVHLDIAGTAWADKDKPYVPKGAVGVGVRLLTEILTRRAEQVSKG
ncbi:MAG: leucyl aminopeptidase [Candidatus Sericytochromatia bacterium]|nr:leucyl aminopeptidase [Candidatus Sericytochromatia bacterium]